MQAQTFPVCKQNAFIFKYLPAFCTLKMNSCLMGSFRNLALPVAFLYHCNFGSQLECPFPRILVWLYLVLSSNFSIPLVSGGHSPHLKAFHSFHNCLSFHCGLLRQ